VTALNIPNSLTIARIMMAPALAVGMTTDVATSIPAAVFAVGMTTDVVDGYLARSRGLLTRFGALMDPIADKLFVGTALVCLAATNRLALWVVLVVFAREILVTVLRLTGRRQGVIIPANRLGKAKTVLQALVVFVLLLADPTAPITLALVYLMVAVTLLSGLVYAAGYMRGRRILVPKVRAASTAGARATIG
jgi:CDP-diacylglycerol---glycerol-3-phosphate 3-phosphatidyltransferase